MSDPRPIGFFDSGVGGLTVLREVRRRLPRESTIYLGDNARAPYGPRPDEEIVHSAAECLDHLVARDVKAIVVACSTSSAVALAQLRRRSDVPVLGVVRPGADGGRGGDAQRPHRGHRHPDHGPFGLLPRAIKDERPVCGLRALATPALVPLVEAGELDGPHVSRGRHAESLGPDRWTCRPGEPIDTLLLGCTHYPLLGPVIADVVGPGVAVIDSAAAIAAALAVPARGRRPGAPTDRQATHAAPDHRATWTHSGARRRVCSGARVPDVQRVALGSAIG